MTALVRAGSEDTIYKFKDSVFPYLYTAVCLSSEFIYVYIRVGPDQIHGPITVASTERHCGVL